MDSEEVYGLNVSGVSKTEFLRSLGILARVKSELWSGWRLRAGMC